jgi:lysophospholipase L1-like esterase
MKQLATLFCTLISLAAYTQVTNQNLFDTIPFMVEHYKKRVAAFEQEPVVTGQIIFLGNSITEGGNWKELTGNRNVINRGIGGDVTFGILNRLHEITKRKPSKIFILIGINDIGKDIPVAKIIDNYRKIIQQIKQESASTSIFVQSIFPVNPTINKFPQHYNKENDVLRCNEGLRQLAADETVSFINLYPFFINELQLLKPEYTSDGLHLNAEGYKVWARHLQENGFL